MDGLVWIEDKVDKNQICLVVNVCDVLLRDIGAGTEVTFSHVKILLFPIVYVSV